MSSIAELVELLKEGSISKEQMLEKIYSASFPQKPESTKAIKSLEAPQFKFESGTDFEFNSNDFEDFHPKPTPLFEPSFSVLSPESFINRQLQWDLKKNINQEVLREKKLRIDVKDCTFKPKTNIPSCKFTKETIERLAKTRETTRLLKIKEDQERKRFEEEMKNCTFQPEINRNSSITGSKYLSDTPKKIVLYEQPAFTPKVKGPSKTMSSANEYLKQDPFERLSRPREPYQPEPEESEITENFFKSQIQYPENPGSSFSTRPFFERQALYEIMKQEKKELLQQITSAKPQINERSKKLVTTDFFERNDEMISKKSTPKQHPNEPNFQPKITNMGKMRRNRSVAEMSYGDLKKKNEKLEYLKELQEDKIREVVNPSVFQSKSYANVKSKLQIADDPDSYVERIKSQQRKKELETQIAKEEKIRQELSECTYAPIVIDAPVYVKQIARNMAMIKAELAANTKPKKPDWK
ncbi:hypothetical protein SteCoe_18797 [Stentor coeruleus]|uniref:Uncharacterized protein n=1 Tax=Stentor coeruleus TaxID=5963 RepID=A0A1R2BW15_9CILI|nr:hypothetical protein SteCoe_18797 [Stentor coeruleus]